MMKIFIFTLIFIFALVMEARPDVIHLKNGRSIEGLIEKETEESVELDVGFGSVKFSRDEIQDINRASPDEVKEIRKGWKMQREMEKKRHAAAEKRREEERRRRELEPKTVGFSQESENIVVSAILNGRVKATLVLDTGASTILLSDRIAEELGISSQPVKKGDMIKVVMADGRQMDARLVVLNSVKVEGAEASDVEAVLLPEEVKNNLHDGLLGMSFLNRFNFQIDTVRKKLILRKRADKL